MLVALHREPRQLSSSALGVACGYAEDVESATIDQRIWSNEPVLGCPLFARFVSFWPPDWAIDGFFKGLSPLRFFFPVLMGRGPCSYE